MSKNEVLNLVRFSKFFTVWEPTILATDNKNKVIEFLKEKHGNTFYYQFF